MIGPRDPECEDADPGPGKVWVYAITRTVDVSQHVLCKTETMTELEDVVRLAMGSADDSLRDEIRRACKAAGRTKPL